MFLKYNDIKNIVMSEYLFSVENMVRYIKKLKRGAAPGCDSVFSEHLKIAINTSLPQCLSDILTLCVRYDVLLRSFYSGILIPLLKQTSIYPSIPKHYRPVVVSTVFSKIMELAILALWKKEELN